MGDIKLFRVGQQGADELKGSSVAIERSLQLLLEANIETLLGVRFLATEYVNISIDPDPAVVEEEGKGFTRDVSRIGHHGTGYLEIAISGDGRLEKAKPLLTQSYEAS